MWLYYILIFAFLNNISRAIVDYSRAFARISKNLETLKFCLPSILEMLSAHSKSLFRSLNSGRRFVSVSIIQNYST